MAREIPRVTTRPWKIMEVCGGADPLDHQETASTRCCPTAVDMGVRNDSWAGCPVCVTPLELIDKALAIAAQPG